MRLRPIKREILITETRIPGIFTLECPQTGRSGVSMQLDGMTYCYRYGDSEMKSLSPAEIEDWLCETD